VTEASSTLRHENIHFVPIIPYRLHFAVAVQKAVAEIERDVRLGGEDLIAVSAPASIRAAFVDALKRLPRVSLLLLRDRLGRPDDPREVVAVTPTDGVVEAARIAVERALPLEFIDCEIAPAHLLERICRRDPHWPDDGIALERGAEAYLDLIGPYLSEPSVRGEPVATWREHHMAERLQLLQPRFRRLLVVCHASHVGPVRRLLGRESPGLVPEAASGGGEMMVERGEPSLPVLLNYLDDFPKLVEKYETYRAAGLAAQFDKRTALLESLFEVEASFSDMRFSPREYDAYTRFLMNLLHVRRRVAPGPREVFQTTAACFNKPFAERVDYHLRAYAGQIEVERVRRAGSEDEYRLAEAAAGAGPYVARACNPNLGAFVAVPVPSGAPVPVPARASPEDENFWLWRPCVDVIRSLALKAQYLVDDRQTTMTEPFQGSIGLGIDRRRTLRAAWERSPVLYVRQPARKFQPLGPEPVVCILAPRSEATLEFTYTRVFLGFARDTFVPVGLQARELALGILEHSSARQIVFPTGGQEGHGPKIRFAERVGFVSFLPALTKKGVRLREVVPKPLEERVPLEREFQYGKDGNLTRELARLETAEFEWWEILLAAGALFALEQVVCVLPDGFRLSKRIVDYARSRRIALRHCSLSRFSRDERRALQREYSLLRLSAEVPGETWDDVRRELQADYSEIMKQFWT
jgi:hypothetical protein